MAVVKDRIEWKIIIPHDFTSLLKPNGGDEQIEKYFHLLKYLEDKMLKTVFKISSNHLLWLQYGK